MRHEYSNTDLGGALDRAESRRGRLRVYRPLGATGWDQREMDDIRAILDALPEPDQQDDWQACEFSDIRKGDRVKRVKKNSDGTISTIEGPATFHHLTGWGTYDYYLAFREDDSQDNITLYRIPAPHPDPAEHPVILIREAVVKHDPPVVAIAQRERVCNEMIYVFGEYGALSPTKITSWSPAKVVEDDR